MDSLRAIRIARGIIAEYTDIEPVVVDGRYNHDEYAPTLPTRAAAEAAQAYNKLVKVEESLRILKSPVCDRGIAAMQVSNASGPGA